MNVRPSSSEHSSRSLTGQSEIQASWDSPERRVSSDVNCENGNTRVFVMLGFSIVLLCSIATIQLALPNFYVRLALESHAAANLILLTGWLAIECRNLKPLLAGTLAIGTTVVATRIGLASEFPRWMEQAIWFVPISLACCVPYRRRGMKLVVGVRASSAKFSIKSMMFATAIVASLFPSAELLMHLRRNGQTHPYLWLVDSLILAIPLCLICLATIGTMLQRQFFHTLILCIAAPLAGFGVAKIYQWDFHITQTWLFSHVALLSVVSGLVLRKMRICLDISHSETLRKEKSSGMPELSQVER